MLFETSIQSLKILSNVVVNEIPFHSPLKINDSIYQATFKIDGGIVGQVDCYLIIKEDELEISEMNYLIPLFIESMNILVGRILSDEAKKLAVHFKFSPPLLQKKSNLDKFLNLKMYELTLDEEIYSIGINFDLKAKS